jgi:hypothetical protein
LKESCLKKRRLSSHGKICGRRLELGSSDENQASKSTIDDQVSVAVSWITMLVFDSLAFIPAHEAVFGIPTDRQLEVMIALGALVPSFTLFLAQKIFGDYKLYYKAYSGSILVLIFLTLVPVDYKDFSLLASILTEVGFLSVFGLFWGSTLLYRLEKWDEEIKRKMDRATILRFCVIIAAALIAVAIFQYNMEFTDMMGYIIWIGGLFITSLIPKPQTHQEERKHAKRQRKN